MEEGGSSLCSDPTTTIVPPTEMLDEKEESGLSKMLTELNLADKYLHKLKSEGVNINDLRETLKRCGDSALERLLDRLRQSVASPSNCESLGT